MMQPGVHVENTKRSLMTGEEKAYLKELVLKKGNIIESKKTDAISVAQKKKAWADIMIEFNSTGENSKRTLEQLRKCWENMKSRRRKELAVEKKSRLMTGGGPYTPPTDDSIDILNKNVDIEIKDVIDSDDIVLPSQREEHYFIDHDYLNTPTQSAENQIEDVVPVLTTSTCINNAVVDTPSTTKKKKTTYFSRGTAIEVELEKRLERTESLKQQDLELHALKIEEQRLKVQEQQIRVEIALELLKQEKIKTQRLLDS